MADSASSEYEVTATKRRPKTFSELAGQEFVVSTLKNSLAQGRIAGAYLFSGPRGCGKTSAARILARSVNCLAISRANGQTAKTGYGDEPCGVCDNCIAIGQGSSMDVIEIDGASNTSINDVRKIQEEILFPPQSGQYKVYIIDEVHMLSNSAFNALLKTIEEPPPYIIFIFATTELHKLPATVKSRCQQFNFRLIPVETIWELLKKICAETGIEAEDDALFWIARESTGSVRDAYTLFDQIASFSGGRIREDLIREKLGLAGIEKLNALAEACAANDAPHAFALLDEILVSGIAIERLIIDLAAYYRSMLLLKNKINRDSLLGYRENQFSSVVLECYDSIRFEQALELLLDCYRDIRYSVSPRFELETVISKLSWLSHWVSQPELKTALDGARNALGGYPPSQEQAAVHNSGSTALQDIRPLANEGAFNNTQAETEKDLRSLSSHYERIVASKTGAASSGIGNGVRTHTGSADEDEDVPFWSSVAQKENKPETDPGLERILKIIPGTLIDNPKQEQ